ncbi:hypothetical protein NQ318_004012 [Aromia moschata]|uniref:Peptidase S1 domain-containing protein n=1 Tax=Aromia moschata TaxID=1265417 RepID=A0AAV8Z848_9CUCU|nr:hypothetical protein NQ318_004012 [Aromia moschata]
MFLFFSIFVRVGEYKISTTEDCENVKREPRCSQYPVQDLAIEEIIIHPKFSTTVFKDDIGLVRVTKMDFKPENVHPICLPVSEEARTKKFNNAVVTGWGYTNPYQPKLGDPGTKADILQQVGLVTRDLKECKKQYDDVPQARIKFTHICSGGFGEKDACPGDSGGPLQKAMDNDEGQLRSFQLGIVSFGPVICGTDGRPGVYTRISYYMDWILDNLKP